MKILFLIDALAAAGKERQLIEVIKGLRMVDAIESHLAVFSSDIHYDYVENLNIQMTILKRRFKKDLTIFRQLYKLCKDFQPNIIHSRNSMTSVYAAPIAKLLGIKFVNHFISDAPARLKAFSSNWLRAKITFPFSDIILANSKAGLKAYNAPPEKSHFVHNGFDFSRIKHLTPPEKIREQFHIKTPKVVGMVARFHPGKDYATFIRAAVQILSGRDDVTFLGIGDGEMLETCREMIPSHYRHRIRFPGKLSAIESIVNIFDVGVLLTDPAVHGEGISNAIMEYMALAKPVVASTGGGTAEIVADEKTGYLIPPKNVPVLAEKIEFLLDYPASATAIGQIGKQKLEADFSLKRMTKQLLAIYDKCLPGSIYELSN